jgi:hypothetical protein
MGPAMSARVRRKQANLSIHHPENIAGRFKTGPTLFGIHSGLLYHRYTPMSKAGSAGWGQPQALLAQRSAHAPPFRRKPE